MCPAVPEAALQHAAGRWIIQVVAAEARARELQEELTGTYREKSRLAEELVAASRQLQIVRDSNEAQVGLPMARPPARCEPLAPAPTLPCPLC